MNKFTVALITFSILAADIFLFQWEVRTDSKHGITTLEQQMVLFNEETKNLPSKFAELYE